jgi:F0F1-type ATP synthase delta subunit
MDICKLAMKIDKLENELHNLKCLLSKKTPMTPIINDEAIYSLSKKELIHKVSYECGYCGESIRKNLKKHKCGQIHDWNL